MHDPLIQVCEVPNPFARRYRSGRTWADRPPLFRVWHRDPERRGDDDSCGWAFVSLTENDRGWAEGRAREEWQYWFSPRYGLINLRKSDDIAVLALAWGEARHRTKGTPRHELLSPWDMAQCLQLLLCPGDNFGHLVTDARKNEEGLAHLLALTLRVYQTRRRPWWRHPRWHVHHWRLQCPPLQTFLRWAFSRCHKCGGRFSWGYCPVGTWDGRGPGWFRNAERVWHQECDESQKPTPVEGAR